MARIRRIALIALAAVLALAPWGLGTTSPVSAAGPTGVATPGTGLVNGQWVKVVLSGFPAADVVVGRQCKASPADASVDCNQLGILSDATFQPEVFTDSTGAATFLIPIYTGTDDSPNPHLHGQKFNGAPSCDAAHPCFPCNFSQACVIALFSAKLNKTGDVKKAIQVPLSFARTPDFCPPVPGSAIVGSGSESAFLATYQWQAAACLSPHNLGVQYAVSSSESGGSDFLRSAANGFGPGGNQFAMTGPVPARGPAEPGVTAPPGVTYKYAPVSASGVVIAYRIYDQLTGNPITDLTLSPDDVARIFGAGGNELQGTEWNRPTFSDIPSLNPGKHFPGRTIPYALAEHSEQTLVLSTFLSKNAPSWNLGVIDTMPVAPQSRVPISGLVTGWVKEGFSTNAVADPTEGHIAIMDSSAAQFYGLPTANLKLGNGTVVAATSDSIAHALSDTTVGSDGTLSAPAQADPAAWPMLMPSYMMVPTNTIAPGQGATVAGFLRFAVSDGQKILPGGYAPLPPDLVDASQKIADQIPGANPSNSPGSPGSANGSDVGSALAGAGNALENGLGLSSGQYGAAASTKSSNGAAANGPGSSKTARTFTLPLNQAGQLWLVARLSWDGAAWVLPILSIVGLAGLVLGPGIEATFRWRRQLSGALRRLLSWL